MKAGEFDKKSDDGVEDIVVELDWSAPTRQSIIKVWIAERLEKAG